MTHGTDTDSITFIIFVIFTGTAILSTLALYTRQSLLIAYIALGMILGPFGLGFITNSELISQTGNIGIIFLLFLLGLNLDPRELIKMLKEISWVALVSSLVFGIIGFAVAMAYKIPVNESIIVGAAMMFSSTIVGLKLLPTTVLHHRHTGDVMVSLLLLQDIIAIVVLLVLQGIQDSAFSITDVARISVGFPALIVFAYFFQRFVLIRLIAKFDRFKEYIFLLSIGWCLAMAEAANAVGLSAEIGAFIAGVSIAANPISLYISENLKPLRDFFLVMFFFTVGAGFNIRAFPSIAIPALVLAGLMMLVKPYTFRFLLQRYGEPKRVSWEVGVRLAQVSEFSLLIAYLAQQSKLIGQYASDLIQAVTILTFIVSTYWVVFKFKTPVAVSDRLRRD